MTSFETDLMTKLGDPEFASAYIMSAIIDNDMGFLPIALGDVAKAHGISKLADETGINRRTLYKVFDTKGHPIFGLVTQIMQSLSMEIQVQPQKNEPPRGKPRGLMGSGEACVISF